jgi:hypothetical protein
MAHNVGFEMLRHSKGRKYGVSLYTCRVFVFFFIVLILHDNNNSIPAPELLPSCYLLVSVFSNVYRVHLFNKYYFSGSFVKYI